MADFHLHTNKSDGKFSIRELVDYCGKLGHGVICITDHLCEKISFLGKAAHYLGCSLEESTFSSYIQEIEEEAERAKRLYNMLVLPGYEITKNSFSNHRSFHILAIGIRKYVNPSLPIEELCTQIRSHSGVVVAAHPVSTRKWEKQTYHLWDNREKWAHLFDAWEVASGPHLFPEVMHSGLPLLANSDMHLPHQIYAWKTIMDCEKSEEAIKISIIKQDLRFHHFVQDTSTFSEKSLNCFLPPFASLST